MEQEQTEFITFCTEMYAKKHEQSASMVAELFCKTGVFDFLFENYTELHSQGKEFLIPLIESFIKEHEPK